MLNRKLALLVLLVSIPADASAQRRTRGEKSANWDEIERNTASTPRITAKDVERFSALKILVDKRKDLKLSDDQAAQLRELGKKETEGTSAQYATFDSLRLAMRPRPGVDPDDERARTTIARQEMAQLITRIRSSYDSTQAGALAVLDDGQQKAATELIQRERAEANENLRDRLGGSRPSGERGGRRRPRD